MGGEQAVRTNETKGMAARRPWSGFVSTQAGYRTHKFVASSAPSPSAPWLTSAKNVRVDSDFSATPFKAKISNAEQLRVHTMLVIGGRDMEAGAVSVRLHHGGPQGAKPKGEVVAYILASIKERRA